MLHRIKQICMVALLVFISCNSKATEENNSLPADNQEQALVPGFSESNPAGDSSQLKTAPASPVIINSVTPVPGAAQTPPVQSQPAAAVPGMNPPHGQPGHRCDIAVGAPLNSPPASMQPPSNSPVLTPQGSSPPVNITSPKITSPGGGQIEVVPVPPPGLTPPGATPGTTQGAGIPPIPPPAPGKTAPGMNPPHGQPGHDCTIAVGAPLKK